MAEAIQLMKYSDLDQVTYLHMEAFSGHRSTSLGKRFVTAEYKWFLKKYPHLALVYKKDSQILAFLTGASSGYSSVLAVSLWREAVIGLLIKPRLLLKRKTWFGLSTYLKYIFRRLIKKPTNIVFAPNLKAYPISMSIALASIGVSSRARGGEIAGQLMDAFEKIVTAVGASQMSLTVRADNESARRAYEKAGWVAVRYHDGVINYLKKLI